MPRSEADENQGKGQGFSAAFYTVLALELVPHLLIPRAQAVQTE